MIWLCRHNGCRILEKLTKNLCVVRIQFREDIVEEKEWFFPRNFLHIFPQETYKSEQQNLIFSPRENIFCEFPSMIDFYSEIDFIEMRSNSCSADDEITFCIVCEEFEKMFFCYLSERMPFEEVYLDESWET